MRVACYHARYGKNPATRYGQPVVVEIIARRGTHPRNVLVKFGDGTRTVTSIGCLRWTCERHGIGERKLPGIVYNEMGYPICPTCGTDVYFAMQDAKTLYWYCLFGHRHTTPNLKQWPLRQLRLSGL